MAVRVNTKFVVAMLAVIAVMVAGMGAFYLYFGPSTPEEQRAEAEVLFERGEYAQAAALIGKAVFDDRNNVEMLLRFIEMTDKVQVKDEFAARKYIKEITDSYLQTTEAQPGNGELLDQYFQHLYDLAIYEGLGVFYITDLSERSSVKLKGSVTEEVRVVATRWRGISTVRLSDLDTTPEMHRQTYEDLTSSLELDPEDHLVLHHLAQWCLIEANRLDRARRPQSEVESLRAQAMEFSRATLDDENPDSKALMAHIDLLVILGAEHREEALALIDIAEERASQPDAPRWFVLRTAERLQMLDQELVRRDGNLPNTLNGILRANQLLKAAHEANPDDLIYQFQLGNSYRLLGQVDDAIAAFELSSEERERAHRHVMIRAKGINIQSKINLTDLKLRQLDQIQDAQAREQHIAEVEERLADLEIIASDAGEVNLLRGKLQMAKGEMTQALISLNKASQLLGGDDVEAVQLVAMVSEQLGQWGQAKQQLERLVELRPTLPGPRLGLAQMLIRSREFDAAQEQLIAARNLGDNSVRGVMLQAVIDSTRGKMDQAIIALESVDRELLDTQSQLLLVRLYASKDRVEDALSAATDFFNRDPSQLPMLRSMLALVTDPDEQLALIDQARKAGADARALNILQKAVESGGELSAEQVAVQMLENVNDPVVRRTLEIRQAYQRGDKEQARQELATLAQSNPDTPAVLVARFDIALFDEDYQVARQVAEVIRQKNLDLARGRFFLGRLSMAQGDWDQAIVEFREALELREVYSDGWMLLGESHIRANNPEAAVTALQRAIEQKPDSAKALGLLGQAYSMQAQHDDALDALRRAWQFQSSDLEAFNRYAAYEQSFGNVETALAIREKMAQAMPQAISNRQALALLYTQVDRAEDAVTTAKQLIDEGGLTRTNTVVLSEVYHLIDQPELGLTTIDRYLNSLGDDVEVFDYLIKARYLVKLQRGSEALAAYAQAREIEDPELQPATRELADLLFSRGGFARSVTLYESLHQQDPSDESVRLRLAEALVRSEQADQAGQYLSGMQDSISVLILRSMIAREQGQIDQARSYIDQAIDINPDAPKAKLVRAQLLADDPNSADMVITDLNRILDSKQGNQLLARTLLADVLLNRGDVEAAARELEAVLTRFPEHAASRQKLIQLYRTTERDLIAFKIAEQGFLLNPSDTRWARIMAQIATDQGNAEIASTAWGYVVRNAPSAESVYELGRAQIQARNPRSTLSLMEEHPEIVSSSAIVQGVRAQALWITGNREGAQRAFELALQRSARLGEIRLVMQSMFDVIGREQTLVTMDSLEQSSDPVWQFAMSQVEFQLGQWDAATTRLNMLFDENEELAPSLAGEARSMLATSYHQAGEFEQATKHYELALESNPNNIQVLNNFAFMLASDLDQASRALPYAEKAVELAFDNALIYDTLGWVQYQNGLYEKARDTLERSIALEPLAANHYHLSQVLIANQEMAGARQLLEQAIALAQQANDREYFAKAQELLESINTP